MVKKRSFGEKIFDFLNILFMVLFCITILYPYLQQITLSLSPAKEASKAGLHLFPTRVTLESYAKVLSDGKLLSAYANTLFVVVTGTLISVVVIAMTAYPLSRKELPNKKLWTSLLMFTMYFSGGLIPSYLLIKNLKLVDSLFAIILPMVMNVFYIIIMRNFFMSIPESLIESAKIDGESEFGILFKIVMPLSRPILATVTLWCAVGYWNEWFKAMIYINDPDKTTLQMLIRRLLGELTTSEINAAQADSSPVTPEGVRAATIILSTVPILCIYPFLQKYFVTGIMIGELELLTETESDYNSKLTVLLSSNTAPDIFFNMNGVTLEELYHQGVVSAIDQDLLAELMPGYKKMIDENAPKAWNRYLVEGKLVAIPNFQAAPYYGMGNAWRADLFKEAGVSELPSTIEECDAVFAKFKEKFPDKYLIGGEKTYKKQFADFVFGAYGMIPYDLTIRDGRIEYSSVQPEIKAALAKLSEWYGLGYIDPECFTDDATAKDTKFINGTVAIMTGRGWQAFNPNSGGGARCI